ncbi:transforming growth factor beta regulator 1 [Mortierella sp. AM989]|nr:transforming growth factor beta regulator 1 [Mortierella sp. AM989]
MKDDPLSFKEKYLRLRERFDRVSAAQRQYTSDLQTARIKARKLKEENNHLLDLLSDMQQMNGSGPSSDSDTSLDDLSDFDDDDDDELREEGLGGQRHERSGIGRTDPTNRTALTGRSRRDATSGHGTQISQDYMNMAGSNNGTSESIENGGQAGSKQTTGSSGQVARTGPSVKKEKPDGAPKQTRKATASAYRGRPRAVVPLPTNPDGSLNYPIVVGKGTNEVIIENMGRIVWQGRGYHNHRYIFPVGFRSKKQYTSLSDTSKKTYFINEILDGGEQPIFQITLEDMPDKVFRHTSSSGAWELALKGLMELGYNAKTHASGPDMYGLTNLGVIKYIQEMPNAHRCRRYMPLKWIIEDDDINSPQSPNGDPMGAKSPGRKKKINNSLYASNHEVLLETMEEAAKMKTSSASRPYTPRKYTKRKTSVPAEQDQSSAILAPPAPVSESESGVDPMEDVKHEIDYSNVTPIMTSTAMTSMMLVTTTASTPATPRSLAGQEHTYHNIPPIQESLRGKNPLHHYENSYGQPLMEP